jgi:hypothetical protein
MSIYACLKENNRQAPLRLKKRVDYHYLPEPAPKTQPLMKIILTQYINHEFDKIISLNTGQK